MSRVAKWNGGPVPEELGGGTRGNTEFKPAFDLGLLSEEVREFYLAMANEDLIEMFDAYADMQFVYEGIEFKYGMIAYDYNAENINLFFENEKAFSMIRSYYYGHRHEAYKCIAKHLGVKYSEKLLDNLLDTVFNYVCEANEQKGTEKDEKGKTIKGPKWVNPAESIKKLLKSKGLI